MKKWSIQATLLISFLFPFPVLSQEISSSLPSQEHHADPFAAELAALKNNTTDHLVILSSQPPEQILQLLEALKNNTSVNYFAIGDTEASLITANAGHHNDQIIAAIAEALNTNTSIEALSLSSSAAAEPQLDEDSWGTIVTAITTSKVRDFTFNGWYLSDSAAEGLAFIMTKTPRLQKIAISVMVPPEGDASVKITQALENSKIQQFIFSNQNATAPFNANPDVARTLAQSMLTHPLEDLLFSGFMIDKQAAELFALSLRDPHVKKVSFTDNGLNDETIAPILPSLQNNPSLRLISFSDQHFTLPATGADILALYTHKDLEKFMISNSIHTSLDMIDKVNFFTKLAGDKNIALLILNDLSLDDSDIFFLSNALLQNNCLSYLDVSSNNYTTTGAQALVDVLGTNTTLGWIGINSEALKQLPAKEVALFYDRLDQNRERAYSSH